VIDTARARALAAAARADTTDGLEAREQLPDVVDALLDLLGPPSIEWAAVHRAADGSAVDKPCDDEADAREFVALMPAGAWVVAHRVHHVGKWVEVPIGAEPVNG